MPTYEYVCRSCDAHLEVVQRFDDAALTECPSCGGALRKAFGNIGIVFKGSGFYKNDSRSVAKSGNGASKSGEGTKDTKDKEKTKESAGGGAKEAGSASTGEGGGGKASAETSGTKDSTGSKGSGSSSAPAAKTA